MFRLRTEEVITNRNGDKVKSGIWMDFKTRSAAVKHARRRLEYQRAFDRSGKVGLDRLVSITILNPKLNVVFKEQV